MNYTDDEITDLTAGAYNLSPKPWINATMGEQEKALRATRYILGNLKPDTLKGSGMNHTDEEIERLAEIAYKADIHMQGIKDADPWGVASDDRKKRCIAFTTHVLKNAQPSESEEIAQLKEQLQKSIDLNVSLRYHEDEARKQIAELESAVDRWKGDPVNHQAGAVEFEKGEPVEVLVGEKWSASFYQFSSISHHVRGAIVGSFCSEDIRKLPKPEQPLSEFDVFWKSEERNNHPDNIALAKQCFEAGQSTRAES